MVVVCEKLRMQLIFFMACAMALTLAAVVPDPADPSEKGPAVQQPRTLICVDANSTMPNWQDASCQTYIRCEDNVPSLIQCQENTLYSLSDSACMNSSEVDCADQNKMLELAIQFTSHLSRLRLPDEGKILQDIVSLQGEMQALIDAGRQAASNLWRELAQPWDLRAKRSVPEEGFVAVDEPEPVFTFDVSTSLCNFMNRDTEKLSDALEAIVFADSDCTPETCHAPNFFLRCDDYDDSADETGPDGEEMDDDSADETGPDGEEMNDDSADDTGPDGGEQDDDSADENGMEDDE